MNHAELGLAEAKLALKSAMESDNRFGDRAMRIDNANRRIAHFTQMIRHQSK